MAQIAQEQRTDVRLQISGEALIYIPILLLTLALRVGMLGTVPLDDAQAHEALAALHRIDPTTSSINPDAPLLPDNALGSLFNSAALITFGSNDAAARLATALAGSFLVLSPLLYRRYLGRVYAMFLSVALMVSPVAIASARTMSGVTWALLVVMLGGWLTLKFWETQEKWFALGAAVCASGILFLTTPYGIFILLGIFFGVSLASITLRDENTRRVFAEWPAFESLMAMLVTLILISTAFLTTPSGLSSVGQVIQQFAEGLSSRQPNTPFGYGFLVALRYEIGWLIFAVIAIWYTWGENTYFERFLTGWLIWSLVCVTFYLGATAEMALLVTLPAAALTASLATRLTYEVSFGYWDVPNWFVPLHAVVVAALVAALTVSAQSLAFKLWDEARVQPFAKVLNFEEGKVRIGTISAENDSSMVANLPHIRYYDCVAGDPDNPPEGLFLNIYDGRSYCKQDLTDEFTFQIKPLDSAVEDATFTVRDPNGQVIYGPEVIGDDLVGTFKADARGEYRLDVTRPETGVRLQAQYMALLYLDDLTDEKGFDEITSGAVALRIPALNAALQMFVRNSPNPAAVIVVPMVLLLIPITFFFGGAMYGAQAAWRGIAYGLMLAIAVFGMAVGWNISTIYVGEARELWTQTPATDDYHTVQQVLEVMSRRANGTKYEIPVTVQASNEGALAWALRRYSNAVYVDTVGPQTKTAAVITADAAPTLGADYVGQALVFGESWRRDSLNWTDFGAWWFQRRTRFQPQPDNFWWLWIEKGVYDVQSVPLP